MEIQILLKSLYLFWQFKLEINKPIDWIIWLDPVKSIEQLNLRSKYISRGDSPAWDLLMVLPSSHITLTHYFIKSAHCSLLTANIQNCFSPFHLTSPPGLPSELSETLSNTLSVWHYFTLWATLQPFIGPPPQFSTLRVLHQIIEPGHSPGTDLAVVVVVAVVSRISYSGSCSSGWCCCNGNSCCTPNKAPGAQPPWSLHLQSRL